MTRQYVVPGRIELVGKHVDYAGGASLTCATAQALTLTARPLPDPVVRIHSRSHASCIDIPLRVERAPVPSPWGIYPLAVVQRLVRDFPCVTRGVEIDIRSNLPESAGLSSSSALTIAVATALIDQNELTSRDEWRRQIPDSLAQAEYYGALETGAPFGPFPGDHGVGVAGGAQDHVAICCARAGHLGLFGYLPARLQEYVPWPDSHALVIAHSGVNATKTGNARAAYNRTSGSLRALVERWNNVCGHRHASLQEALSSAPGAAEWFAAQARAGLPEYPGEYLFGRFEQFIEESRHVVPGTVEALHRQDWTTFGRWVARSYALAESGLRNQVAETSALVRLALHHGAVAASAFGAGFGGAVWSAVARADVDRYLGHWRTSYLSDYPEHAGQAEFFVTQPGAPAHVRQSDEPTGKRTAAPKDVTAVPVPFG
jgi:galactokinase